MAHSRAAKMARPPSRSRFMEGSMNDRASAAPPVHFIGPDARMSFDKPDVVMATVRAVSSEETVPLQKTMTQPERQQPLQEKTEKKEQEKQTTGKRGSKQLFGQVWTGITEKLGIKRAPVTTAPAAEKTSPEKKQPTTTYQPDDRPSRDEIYANYHHLVASGFFSAHAIQSTPQQTPTMDIDPKYDNYDFPHIAATKQDGHAGHLTEGQIAQVHQLRLMLEAEGCTKRLDTLTLLRFLRARKFDVNLSKAMFLDTEKWRKDTNLDEVVPVWDYPEKEQIKQYYEQYYHKTDKDGRPVYIETLGGIDLTAMYKITTSERMLTNLAVEYERCADPRFPACCRKHDQLIETCCTIMDLKGVALTRVPSVYSYVRQAAVLSQNYYPERLGKFYLINAPWGFSTVWSVVKGWLDPVTVSKINILGGNYQSELLKQIPAENLPKAFGGTCECAGGCDESDDGPWRDPQWTKPAWWEKEGAGADSTINNEGSTIEKPEVTTGPATTVVPEKSEAPVEDKAAA